MKYSAVKELFDEIHDLWYDLKSMEIRSSELFYLLDELSSKAEPTEEETYKNAITKTWAYFYFPVENDTDEILLPAKDFAILYFALHYVKRRNEEFYYMGFPTVGGVYVEKGDEKPDSRLVDIINETKNFLPRLKEDTSLPEKYVPYRYRIGKIKRKYVHPPEMTLDEANKILKMYEKRNKGEIYPVSLRDYLRVAGICLRTVYPKDSELSDLKIYRKHADFRHGGMLDLPMDDKKAFVEWYEGEKWIGSHPFEIIAGFSMIGMLLYPPSRRHKRYNLSISSLLYSEDYVKCVEALINQNIPFDAPCLQDALDLLTGEIYISVNEWGGVVGTVYCDGDEDFVKYVEWRPLHIPKLKI